MSDLHQIIDYLRKPELSFEVMVRGGGVGTVRTMRPSLRGLLQAGSEPCANKITDNNIEEQLELAQESLDDLQDKFADLNPTQNLELVRFNARLELFEARLSLLTTGLNNLNLNATEHNGECNRMLASLQMLKLNFQSLSADNLNVSVSRVPDDMA